MITLVKGTRDLCRAIAYGLDIGLWLVGEGERPMLKRDDTEKVLNDLGFNGGER